MEIIGKFGVIFDELFTHWYKNNGGRQANPTIGTCINYYVTVTNSLFTEEIKNNAYCDSYPEKICDSSASYFTPSSFFRSTTIKDIQSAILLVTMNRLRNLGNHSLKNISHLTTQYRSVEKVIIWAIFMLIFEIL